MSNSGAQATLLQQQAAHPAYCVWVAASAGTGKTKVLTDRLLHLLLEGAAPNKLLCLTFTRAAAGEMANRLQARLGQWATLKINVLQQQLENLLGRPATPQERQRAQNLFHQITQAPGGVRISTIHGFCQTILRQFPIEAALPPQFTVMDPLMAQELIHEATEKVLENNETLKSALKHLSPYYDYEQFIELLHQLLEHRDRLPHHLTATQARQALAQRLQWDYTKDPTAIWQDACTLSPAQEERLFVASEALHQGSPKDQERAQSIVAWLKAHVSQRVEGFQRYKDLFLTHGNEVRTTLITKAAAQKNPESIAVLQQEAQRIRQAQLNYYNHIVGQVSWALYEVTQTVVQHYHALKQQKSLLDYHDLIFHTAQLLHRKDVAPWVLYKLDGGIDHILIDEAQDTNLLQWKVIAALAEEFFAGRGAREVQRTLFVVGDAKQSIYSFQGANPYLFRHMRNRFAHLVQSNQQQWQDIHLQISFRSTAPILHLVDHVFSKPELSQGVLFFEEAIRHEAYRLGHAGHVELWPLVTPHQTAEPMPWTLPDKIAPAPPRPAMQLAQQIAQKIARWLEQQEQLPSQGRPISPGDILILVQQRGELMECLFHHLKQQNIPVAGRDRMLLADNLAIQDLLAMARFALLPADDLTLAVVLKTPCIGLEEQHLYDIAHERGENSLWEQLHSHRDHPIYKPAYTLLVNLRAAAGVLTPYDFFSYILNTCQGRKAFQQRLGHSAIEAIDEFLTIILQYQQHHYACLQSFLLWFEKNPPEIKREFGYRDEVRIMTVHGAKGLQAPIVFMPDTVSTPQVREDFLWLPLEDGDITLPLWLGRAPVHSEVGRALKQWTYDQGMQEYRRLLYVALTRAQDWLYICGYQNTRRPTDQCWYSILSTTMREIGTSHRSPDTLEEIWTLQTPQQISVTPRDTERVTATLKLSQPAWVKQALQAPLQDIAPTGIAPLPPGHKSNFDSLLSEMPYGRLRGLAAHKLLQYLPDLPTSQWDQAMPLLLQEFGLSATEEETLCRQVATILQDRQFAFLFAEGSNAEVPITCEIAGRPFLGRIDRLLVMPDKIIFVDYKTGRQAIPLPAPYQEQMHLYAQALRCLYPGRPIQGYILWLQEGALVEVVEAA